MINTIRAVSTAIVLSASAIAANAQAASIADGGFEMQGAAYGDTCSFNTGCAGGAWSGSGDHSGINFNNGQNFAGSTPDGSYYAFLQSNNGGTSTVSQSVTVAAGNYVVSWLAGGRTNYSGPVNYTVSLGSQIYSGTLAQAQPFTATSATVALAAGIYTLAFTAHTASGDNSALIDRVSIDAAPDAVPEPATWALMLSGFGVIGATMRRRTAQIA